MENKILSIQSHVVSGVVGNKGAAFTLRVMGISVDEIPTVVFSNLPSLEFAGLALDKSQISQIYDCLSKNELNNYSHLITGYVRDKEVLMEYVNIVKDLKKNKKFKLYICDPVLGDNDRFYVSQELVNIYVAQIFPLADIIVPNKFEAEQLSGLSLSHNSEDITAVLKKLHDMGPTVVIISSIEGEFSIITVSSKKNSDGTFDFFKVEYDKVITNFAGTGDIFTALITGFYIKTGCNLRETILKAVSVMQFIIKKVKNEIGFTRNIPTNIPIEKFVQIITNPSVDYQIKSI